MNGITVHVRGANGAGANAVSYLPPVVNVAAAAAGRHQRTRPAGRDRRGRSGQPGRAVTRRLQRERPAVEAAEAAGPRPGWHHRRARAAVTRPRGPAVRRTGLGRRRPLLHPERAAFDATVAAHGPYAVDAGLPTVLRGADITVVAQSPTAYNLGTGNNATFAQARIDGLSLMTGKGEGAGGVQVQAHANNLQLTNNVLENNSGVFAGGVECRPAVRARQPQLQRPDRQQSGDRQRWPDPLGRPGHLLRLQQLRRGEQHRLRQLRRGVRRGHLALGPEPWRQDPRQPDLLQRRRWTPVPASRSRPRCRWAAAWATAQAPWTWTAT